MGSIKKFVVYFCSKYPTRAPHEQIKKGFVDTRFFANIFAKTKIFAKQFFLFLWGLGRVFFCIKRVSKISWLCPCACGKECKQGKSLFFPAFLCLSPDNNNVACSSAGPTKEQLFSLMLHSTVVSSYEREGAHNLGIPLPPYTVQE